MKNKERCAFPVNDNIYSGESIGLTKREYTAISALSGLMASLDGNIQGQEPNEQNILYYSALAVKAADFLLQELAKPQPL